MKQSRISGNDLGGTTLMEQTEEWSIPLALML